LGGQVTQTISRLLGQDHVAFYNKGSKQKELFGMTLKELEKQVAQLPPEELAEFREWFLRFDGDRWDEQIEHDVSTGKLDALGRDAITEPLALRMEIASSGFGLAVMTNMSA
jgi:hypothetical protein